MDIGVRIVRNKPCTKLGAKAIKYIFYLAIFLFNGAEGAEDFFEICAGGAKQNTETPKLRKIRIIKFRNSRTLKSRKIKHKN